MLKIFLSLFCVVVINAILITTLPTQDCPESHEFIEGTTNKYKSFKNQPHHANDSKSKARQYGGVIFKKEKVFRNVTHLIFDLDDTLLNTEAIYELMLKKLCNNHGKELPDGFRERFLGSPVEHALKALKEELNIETSLEDLIEEMKKITEETYQTTPIQLMKGAEKLLRHFHHFGIPMAIATSSFKKEAEIKTTQEHLKELFSFVHHIVTADDVTHGKPAPDIFILAASKFPSSPKQEDCLVFEDSPNGLRASYTARMQCVFIPEVKIENEYEEKATIILKSLEDFQPELFGLPPFKDKNV